MDASPNNISQDKGSTEFHAGAVYAELKGEHDLAEQEANPSVAELSDHELLGLARLDERVQAGAQNVRNLRKMGDQKSADEAVDMNREVLDLVLDELRHGHGQKTAAEKEREAENIRLDKLVKLNPEDASSLTDDEKLKYFGLVDEEGRVSLDSPLVSNSAKHAYDIYLVSVRQTEAMSKVANQYGIKVKGFITADNERKEMHDAVAKLLSEDLDIGFDDARKMVAKARDGAIPGAGETQMYGTAGLKLLDRAGNDLSYGSIEAHKRINRIVDEHHDHLGDDTGSESGSIGLSEPLIIKLPHVDVFSAITKPKNDFQSRAELLLDEMRRGVADSGVSEVVDALREKYLHKPDEDIELQRLTAVILRSRQQSILQDQLNADRLRLHEEGLTHTEKISVGGHYEMLRHEACDYNHSLRTLMENCSQHFTRSQLIDWVGRASQGHYDWADGEVTGAVSEIAVHAALQGLPELKGVRYGTVEEDLAGYDFVCEWKGELLSIDAKTGHYPPVEEFKHGHRHIEVSVPREVVKDFNVTRHGLDIIRFDIKHALSVEAGMVPHASHHHYGKA